MSLSPVRSVWVWGAIAVISLGITARELGATWLLLAAATALALAYIGGVIAGRKS